MPRIVHFEVHADDPERAAAFYTSIFGWEIKKWEGGVPQEYWVITTGPANEPGINGGMVKRQGKIDGEAVIAYVCTMEIQNLDEYIAKVIAKGGNIALPKMEIPDLGWLAYCKDTEGNIFGLMQSIKK